MANTNKVTSLPNLPAKTLRKAPRRASRKAPQAGLDTLIQRALIPAVSVLIPLFSVGFVKLAGTQWVHGSIAIAMLTSIVAGLIFTTSLKHAASSLRAITKIPARGAWILAFAFDGAVVVAELTHSLTPELGLGNVCLLIMGAVGCLSAAMNYSAFRAHQKGE